MATIGLAGALLLGYAFDAPLRPRLRASVLPIAAGYVLSLLLIAPFTYYLLSDFASESVQTQSAFKLDGSDALAAVVPNELVGIAGNDLGSIANHAASKMAYLGLPTVIIIGLYAVRSGRTPAGRFLLTGVALAFIVTLGLELQVYGLTLATAPWWNAASGIPGLADALPYRFGLLEALVASVIVALWIARTRGIIFRRPYLLPILAVAALAPALWHPSLFEQRPPPQARFFTTGLFKSCIPRGETLMVFPMGNDPLLWQALTGFRYDLATDGLQPFPQFSPPLNRFDRDPVIWDLAFVGDPTTERLLAFAGTHNIDRFVSIGNVYPTAKDMRAFGKPTILAGAVISPGCNQPSLRTRDLSRYVSVWEHDPKPYDDRPNVLYCGATGIHQQPAGLTPPPGTTIGSYVEGHGVTCSPTPRGYRRHGYASATFGVPPDTYPYFQRLTSAPRNGRSAHLTSSRGSAPRA